MRIGPRPVDRKASTALPTTPQHHTDGNQSISPSHPNLNQPHLLTSIRSATIQPPTPLPHAHNNWLHPRSQRQRDHLPCSRAPTWYYFNVSPTRCIVYTWILSIDPVAIRWWIEFRVRSVCRWPVRISSTSDLIKFNVKHRPWLSQSQT